MNRLETARGELREIILNALGGLVACGLIPSEPLPCFDISLCEQRHGNLTCNAALVGAKSVGKTPAEFAEMLCGAADLYGSAVSKISPTENGFINARIDDSLFPEGLKWNIRDEAAGLRESVVVSCVGCNDEISLLKAAVNADCICRLVRYCGGKAEYRGACFEKYNVSDNRNSSAEAAKKLFVGAKKTLDDICEKGDVRVIVKNVRLLRGGEKAIARSGAALIPENLTDELTADEVRFFFALDVNALELSSARIETTDNPFYAFEKANSLCNRAIPDGYLSDRLDDTEKNLIFLAYSLCDVIRHSLYKYSAKPLCELAAALSRSFVRYYYSELRSDKRVSEAVLGTLEAVSEIIGIRAPKKI